MRSADSSLNRLVFDFMLRLSYSSELGAATAYGGHAAHIGIAAHREHVLQVQRDELHHRDELLAIMEARGVRPWGVLELFFLCFGSCVAFGCRFWGDWASAFGASLFEVNGVAEYTRLEALAQALGEDPLLADFRRMAQQEQAHRDLFLEMARGAEAKLPDLQG
ncbi:MAG: ferritin-like domain-containing protein [Myxococcota bacterium]